MRRVVFIAGPYRGKNDWETTNNIKTAERIAVNVWRAGHIAICPHKNSAYFSGSCTEENFLEGYLELLERCDDVILTPDWPRSRGTKREIMKARELDIPIFPHFNDWHKLFGREIV